MRNFRSILLLISAICIGIAICSSIPQARANPPPHFDPEYVDNGFDFIIAQIIGFIVGTSVLVFGAREEGGRVVRTIIFTMIISYLPSYLIWTTTFNSGLLSGITPVWQAVVVTLIPEVLGTALGTVFIKKTLDLKWKMALFGMGALMLSSLIAGQLLYVYVDFNRVFYP